jgi:dTDP-4-dehydrorhamnose 3,5-epimerase
MTVHGTPLPGAYTLEPDRQVDSRGFFARVFCEREFAEAGLNTRFPQVSVSCNKLRGTLRGMHYRLPPACEIKLVRCVRGALYDVIVDLRPDSASFGRWFGTELSAGNGRMLYIPRGFAHGYLTLADDTEVMYWISEFHAPGQERGLRHDDPWMAIDWPQAPAVMADKDRSWPLFEPGYHGIESLRGLG